MKSVKAEYELQLDDLQAFVDFETPRHSKLPLYGSLLAYGSVLAYAFTVLPINSALMLLLPAFIWAMTLIRSIRARAPGRARIRSIFCGVCELKIERDYLAEIRSSGELRRNWSVIDRIVKTKTHVFIYASGLLAFVLPRRAFLDDFEFNRFLRALEDRSNVIATTA